MKQAILAAMLISLPSTAVAQSNCWRGAYGTESDAYALVMNPPEITSDTMIEGPTIAKKKLVIARQEYSTKPKMKYLEGDIDIDYNSREKLSKFVPMGKGAPISVWRNRVAERHCSIGWQKGLFGGATGDGHYRWVCFQDKDKDGKFEKAWRPKGGSLTFMDITPPVGWTETQPDNIEVEKKGGPLSSYPASRTIEVKRVSKKSVRIQYWGVGVARGKQNRVDLNPKVAGSTTLGGITINLTPGEGKAPPTLTASGSFTQQNVRESCRGTNYSIGTFNSRVMFSFPDW